MYSLLNSAIDALAEWIITLVGSHYENRNIVYYHKCNEQLLHRLIGFLQSGGFPNESFDLHFPVSKYFHNYAKSMTPDLTVVSTETMEPLAFFRIVDNLNDFSQSSFLENAYHLNKHTPTLNQIPYYIVMLQDEIEGWHFFNVLSALEGISSFYDIPNKTTHTTSPHKYEILLANERNYLYHRRLIKTNKVLNYGRISFSFAIPIMMGILLFLDFKGIYELSELRLVTIGIVIACLLIPYLAQVSIKDFSLSFKKDK